MPCSEEWKTNTFEKKGNNQIQLKFYLRDEGVVYYYKFPLWLIYIYFIVREPGDMVSKGADKMVASTQDIYAGNFLIFY